MGVVGGLWAVVVVGPDVVDVGKVVEVVDAGLEVVGLEVLVARPPVEPVVTLEVVVVVERVAPAGRVVDVVELGILAVVFVAGLSLPASVVGVTEVVGVVEVPPVAPVVPVAPVAVRGGVWGANVPEVGVLTAVLGTAPGGVLGAEVLVVDELLVMVGWSVGVGRVDVVLVGSTDVLDDAGTVVVVTPVVEVVLAGVVVVVAPVVEVGTVVVVTGVVVVNPLLVVVVTAVVVVTDDVGANVGLDDVVSATAATLGATNAPSARPVANSAAPPAAARRASHLLELWEDKRIRAPNVCKSGRQSQLAVHR